MSTPRIPMVSKEDALFAIFTGRKYATDEKMLYGGKPEGRRATEEKQKADVEKKRVDVVLFEDRVAKHQAEAAFVWITVIQPSNEIVSKCRIPTAAVIHYGLFRILGL